MKIIDFYQIKEGLGLGFHQDMVLGDQRDMKKSRSSEEGNQCQLIPSTLPR